MNSKDEILEEYDFSNGIRGKYAQAYKEGVNIVKIDNDVMKFFHDTKSINEALRTFINLMNNSQNPLKLSSSEKPIFERYISRNILLSMKLIGVKNRGELLLIYKK